MDDLLESNLLTIADAIKNGTATSKEVTRGFLDRIEKVNPMLNAVVYSTAEHAMKMAAKADQQLATGELTGPLHGVPITIKDSLDTIDAVTTWGTGGREEVRPGADATCVARLRAAGAIIMGKTNTPEFTLAYITDNLVYGRTNNPHDIQRTPGGSSGGAAAIIAAGGSPLDIGTDTGGSIRLPAHFCGIAGIKPTTGRVPCTGNALPTSGLLAPLSQPGPLARSVDDLIYTLPLISGPDLLDPHTVEAPLYDVSKVNLSQIRVGYHSDNGICTPAAGIQSAINMIVDNHCEAFADVTEAHPWGLEMASLIMQRLMTADGGEMVEALLEDARTQQASPQIQRHLDNRTDSSARELANIITTWHNFQSSMLSFFNDFDVLICPVNGTTAHLHDQPPERTAYSYTSAYNLTGWPGVVIPVAKDDDGLPVGIQILSRPYREDIALAVAKHLESAVSGTDMKPDSHVTKIN